MTVEFRASLFDTVTPEGTGVRLGDLGGTVRRRELTRGAWIDVRPAWATGSDELFARLVTQVPWQAERRTMWDNVVDVPRLLRFYGEGQQLPDPLLEEAREALSRHYAS